MMSKSLFFDAFSLLKLWAFGFFGLHIGWLIHMLPAIAVFAILLGLIKNNYLIRLEKPYYRGWVFCPGGLFAKRS